MSLKDVDKLIRELGGGVGGAEGTAAMADRDDAGGEGDDADVELRITPSTPIFENAPSAAAASASAAASSAAASSGDSAPKKKRPKVVVKAGPPPSSSLVASTGSTSMLEMSVNASESATSNLRVAGVMPSASGSATNTQRVPQRVRVEITDDPVMTQEEEDAADIKHYLSQVGLIIEPVLLCIFIVVWWVKVDQSGGATDVSSIRYGRRRRRRPTRPRSSSAVDL